MIRVFAKKKKRPKFVNEVGRGEVTGRKEEVRKMEGNRFGSAWAGDRDGWDAERGLTRDAGVGQSGERERGGYMYEGYRCR